MDNETFGALKRIIEEVKEYRKLSANMIMGNDIQLVETWVVDWGDWIDEVVKITD